MRKLPVLISIAVLLSLSTTAQFEKPVNDAFIITRMADKFHYHPKPLNDSFSSGVLTLLLKELDEEKLFFTAEDIKTLSAYRYTLDDEIKNRRSAFLSLLTKIYNQRLLSADTMISSICKTPFDFSAADMLTITEMETYPPDEKAMRKKLYHSIKASVLRKIIDEDTVFKMSSKDLKKFVDSVEPLARRRMQTAYLHPGRIMLNGPGGIQQSVGQEYCKAIAECYDPHTEFFPADEKENFESMLGNRSMVFGFSLKEEDDGSVEIDDLEPGSAAFKSGQLNKGDKIQSIQWKDQKPIDVANAGLKEVTDVIDMSNHEKATFKVKKADGTERTVSLWKEKQEDEDDDKVKSFLLKGSKTVGFISLPSFYEDWENDKGIHGCANDVAKEILKLKQEKIEGLIIDLRYNGGGSMQEAVELAGIFIDAGPVGQLKTREGKAFTLKDVNRGTIYDGPLMILVNGYSASASEMVAGTLQDYNRAVIAGSPTYGKATAQVVLPMDTTIDLDKEDFLKIKTPGYLKTTISQLFRATGNTAQAKGVKPDILLPDLLDARPGREADEPNVLLSGPIEASRFFNPFPPMQLEGLRTLARSKMDSSYWFTRLSKYLASKSKTEKKDINLKLQDVITAGNSRQNNRDTIINKQKPSFTIQHHAFEKQQMLVNEYLRDLNEQWDEYLGEDPYVGMAYDLMLLLIK